MGMRGGFYGFARGFRKPDGLCRCSAGPISLSDERNGGKRIGQGGFFRRRPLDNPRKSVQAGARPPPENHPRRREFEIGFAAFR